MKKTKLLMPLAGVAALGAVAPTIMAATSCNKQVKVTDLTITLDPLVTNIYVGTKLSRDQFKVDAKMSDGTTKEDVQWTCDKFDAEGNYMFTEAGKVEFTFVYEKFEKKVEYTAAAVTDATFLSSKYTLATNTNAGTTINTSIKLSIYSKGSIMELDPSLFKWTVADPTKLDVDPSTGIAIAKATGSTKVTAQWKDQTNAQSFECDVLVQNDATLNVTTYDETMTANIQMEDGLADTNGIVAVPGRITKTDATASKTYTVNAVSPNSTALTKIKTVILPSTITEIGANTFADSPLHSIMYNGTQADWMENVYYQTGDNWAGDYAIGVYCLDGLLNFDRRYQAVQLDAQGTKYLSNENGLGRLVATEYVVEFDFSKLTMDAGKTVYDYTIKARNSLLSSLVTISNLKVMADGAILTSGTDYTYSNNILTIDQTKVTGLTNKSKIIVHFKAPSFHTLNKIYLEASLATA